MPKVPLWLFIVLALLYFSSARLDVMDIDASQYAEISREMIDSDNWLQIYDRGRDYLDKPPFLFWASAASMKLFGVNNFGYRFPSILFALLAIYATYRLARKLYDEPTGRVAALVFGSCQGMFLWTNDIRTDTILMSAAITSIWLINDWIGERRLWKLLLGCVFIAIGMMTKGPVALMVPVFCFATHWALRREWKHFLQPAYLLGLVVIAVLLIPMSIGLYQQYDAHPEKVIDGQTGTSGLRFFYWSQSFGRITGESPWDNNAPFSFLYENMLWAFLPWIIFFSVALLINIIQLARQRLRLSPQQEWITTGGFILTYLSLASSRYQLPHYLFIAYPLAAIMVAALLRDFYAGKYRGLFRILKPVHVGISMLLLVAAAATFLYVFKGGVWQYIVWIAGLLIWLGLALTKRINWKFFWLPVAAIIIANIFMTHHFYYELFKFQAGGQVGRYIRTEDIPADSIRHFQPDDPLNSLHFYARRVVKATEMGDSGAFQSGRYLLTSNKGLDTLGMQGRQYDILHSGRYYKVSELTPQFINPETRDSSLKSIHIVRLK